MPRHNHPWTHRVARLTILLALLFSAGSLWAQEQLFDLKKVTDGVYLAVAREAHVINSNAAVIILDDGVLVADTHSKPSAARALIEQIKTITDKPIRYVVDTHFHYDHFQGNGAYLEAFPGAVEIIASAPTRDGIVHRGIPRIKAEIIQYAEQVEQGKRRLAETTDEEKRAKIEKNLAGDQEYLDDLKNIGDVLPTMSFEKSLVLHRGDRIVQILFLGRGHTDGDTVIYLPKEKLICTGDLLHAWDPYMPDSHPYDWIRTLQALERMDFERILPGHGDVLEGKGQVILWRSYIQDLMKQVEKAYAEGVSEEDLIDKVDLEKWIERMPTLAEGAIPAHLRKAYREVSWEE